MSRIKAKLPVVDSRRYPAKWFYVVEYEGATYQVQMLPFQRESGEMPAQLDCLIERKPGSDGVYIKQDFAPLLAARYKTGGLYDFVVEEDYTASSTPHYKVADGSGFWFKLYAHAGSSDFRRGDKVRCRITRVMGISVSLEAVGLIADNPNEVLSLDMLRQLAGEEPVQLLIDFLEGSAGFDEAAEMLERGDYRWIFMMIDVAWNEIVERSRREHMPVKQAAHAFHRILLNLLENSDYLNTLEPEVKAEAQDSLSMMTARTEDLLEAIKIVEEGNEQEFISETLDKMAASGYLYRPAEKLRLLMFIFALRKESMDSNMQKLLDTIHKGRKANWTAEPFRSAFISQLELYVGSNHAGLDALTVIDTPETRDRFEKMLQALSIQQLLAREGENSFNQVINRSRLYRYFTYIQRFEQDRLLDKALTTVRSRTVIPQEFKWDDTAQIDAMATRLLAPVATDYSLLRFDTPEGIFTITDGKMKIATGPQASRPALPASLELWNDINVNLAEPLPPALRQPRTVRDYKSVWAEIERSFFNPDLEVEKAAAEEQKPTPDVGDRVTVIVDSIDSADELRLHCTIVDPEFSGQGWTTTKRITNMDRHAPLWSFRNTHGRPYLLDAEVESVDGDEITFTMRPPIQEMISEIVEPGTEVSAVITYCSGGRYIAFSEYGYSMFVDANGFNLDRSMFVRIAITNVKADGSVVWGKCVATNGEPVEYAESVQALMATFSDDRVVELPAAPALEDAEQDVTLSTDEMLTTDEMAEIMRIVGRKGDVEQDLVKRFNYHSFARLIARLLGLSAEADYYLQRCAVIEVLDDFATNGQVDPARLETIAGKQDILTSTADGRKLMLLSMLDRPESNPALWAACNENAGELSASLARLVLAYNLLDGFKMADERGRLRAQISQLLGLRRDVQPEQIENGNEGQRVEFKTSAIYPAGPKVRIDVKAQTAEIVEKITGMLNADGGRIYVGVSDEGYIRGLAEDMRFFGTHDKFELNMRNAITLHCGFIPNGNAHIRTSWQTHGDKEVYVIDIAPVYDPVAFDGIYYQRQGSSNRFVPSEQVESFIAARRKLGAPVEAEAAQRQAQPAAKAPAITAVVPAATRNDDCTIATSRLRPNVLHESSEGYHPVSAWLYFGSDGSLTVTDHDTWMEEDYPLAIALTEEEMNNSLLLIYKSGHVANVPMRYAIKEFDTVPRRLRADDPVVFASPIAPGQGLILYSSDQGGNLYKQAFRPESLVKVKTLRSQGEALMKDMTPQWAELIPEGEMASFSAIVRNAQRVKGSLAADVESHTAPRLGVEC